MLGENISIIKEIKRPDLQLLLGPWYIKMPPKKYLALPLKIKVGLKESLYELKISHLEMKEMSQIREKLLSWPIQKAVKKA